MNRRELLLQIAPCGLDCGRCLNNPNSPISRHARSLLASLDGFAKMAKGFARMDAAFGEYPAFERVAGRLASGGCSSCRDGNCLLADCGVKDCIRARGLDFCHECAEFPCAGTNMPPSLRELWQANNERMRQVGLTTYFAELRAKPRY